MVTKYKAIQVKKTQWIQVKKENDVLYERGSTDGEVWTDWQEIVMPTEPNRLRGYEMILKRLMAETEK